jgi:hypothetical protein
MADPLILASTPADLQREVDRLIADGDDSALLDGVGGLPKVVAELRTDPSQLGDVQLALWNAGAIGAIALRRGKDGLFDATVGAILATYRLGDVQAEQPDDSDASLFENAAAALWALGTVAVELGRWAELRRIVTEQPEPDGYWPSWLRHAQTMSARTSTYVADDSILNVAASRLDSHTGYGMAGRSEADRTRDLCAFDFLALLVVASLDHSHPSGHPNYYPSFAKYTAEYVEPLVWDLRREGGMREAIFPGSDEDLRGHLRETNEMALFQAGQLRWADRNWEYRGFTDPRTWAYIREGHTYEEWVNLVGGFSQPKRGAG